MLKDYTWWLQAEYFVWDVDLCCVWRLLSGSRDTGRKRLKRFSWLWVHVGFCGISLASCQVCAIFHSLWGLWRAWGMSWFYKYFLCGGFGWFFSPQWQSYLGTLICISLLWSMWGPALLFLVWGASAGIGISFFTSFMELNDLDLLAGSACICECRAWGKQMKRKSSCSIVLSYQENKTCKGEISSVRVCPPYLK